MNKRLEITKVKSKISHDPQQRKEPLIELTARNHEAIPETSRHRPQLRKQTPMPAAFRKNPIQAEPVSGRSAQPVPGIVLGNNNNCVERISNCLLNQVRKMHSDTELSKCQQAFELERLKTLHKEEMDEAEQEIYNLYSQTASIDQTCTRISQELDTILGKHEYLKQLREHTKKKDNLLKYALRQNPAGEKLWKAKEKTFTIANVTTSVHQRLPVPKPPLVDKLKRNLETKLDKLRFLQSIADGIKEEAVMEVEVASSRVPEHGINSPAPGITSNLVIVPSKLTLQNLLRHDQLTQSPSSYAEATTKNIIPSQDPEYDELESVPEELDDVQRPSSKESELDTVISDYEEEKPYADEEVLTDDDEEVFPSSREEDNWADSEGESNCSRKPSRMLRPRPPDSTTITTSTSTQSTDELCIRPVVNPAPLGNKLDEYQPPKNFPRTKLGVQPLKALVFPWMAVRRSKAQMIGNRKVDQTSGSSRSRSVSDTSVKDLGDYGPKAEQPSRTKSFMTSMLPKPMRLPAEALIVTGKAIPPIPPSDPAVAQAELKEKRSRLPIPSASKKLKVQSKPNLAAIITEIPAEELMADVSTALEPPRKAELLEKAKRVEMPKRPSLNVAKTNRPLTPKNHPNQFQSARSVKSKNTIDTIFHNPSGVGNQDSEENLGKDLLMPRNTSWTNTPGSTSRKQVIYGSFEAGPDDKQVKPILRNKSSIIQGQDPPFSDMATATEGRVKFRKVSMRMDPDKTKPDRFAPFNTFPPRMRPNEIVSKGLLAKIIPDSPTRNAVASGMATIARMTDSRTVIRKNKPITPTQFKTEYGSNFKGLVPKKSEYKGLNSYRKPPVPSHIVVGPVTKPNDSIIPLSKKSSASGNYYMKSSKRPSVSNLGKVLKSKSKTKLDSMKRAKAQYSRTTLDTKAKNVTSKKILPEHLAFGNFNGIKSARSSRMPKPDMKELSLQPESLQTSRTAANISRLWNAMPKKTMTQFPSKFPQSRSNYFDNK